jgi:hypothetical protein
MVGVIKEFGACSRCFPFPSSAESKSGMSVLEFQLSTSRVLGSCVEDEPQLVACSGFSVARAAAPAPSEETSETMPEGIEEREHHRWRILTEAKDFARSTFIFSLPVWLVAGMEKVCKQRA